MILLGVIHIILLILAYVLYFFITLRSFSGKNNFLMLFIANLLYLIGFILGMFWAKIDWGFYLSFDIKMILSILVFIPFLLENIFNTKKFWLPLIGIATIILNYVLPLLLNSIHSH